VNPVETHTCNSLHIWDPGQGGQDGLVCCWQENCNFYAYSDIVKVQGCNKNFVDWKATLTYTIVWHTVWCNENLTEKQLLHTSFFWCKPCMSLLDAWAISDTYRSDMLNVWLSKFTRVIPCIQMVMLTLSMMSRCTLTCYWLWEKVYFWTLLLSECNLEVNISISMVLSLLFKCTDQKWSYTGLNNISKWKSKHRNICRLIELWPQSCMRMWPPPVCRSP